MDNQASIIRQNITNRLEPAPGARPKENWTKSRELSRFQKAPCTTPEAASLPLLLKLDKKTHYRKAKRKLDNLKHFVQR